MLNQRNSSAMWAGWAAIYRNFVLTAIAIFLGLLVMRSGFEIPTAQAQSSSNLYVEPGTSAIRRPDGMAEMQGKVVIDLQRGDIWGFPTLSSAPYPVDVTSHQPPVVKGIYLGKFDFGSMHRP